MNTKLVTLRIPEEDLGDAEKLASAEKRSRAQILLRWISVGRALEKLSIPQALRQLDKVTSSADAVSGAVAIPTDAEREWRAIQGAAVNAEQAMAKIEKFSGGSGPGLIGGRTARGQAAAEMEKHSLDRWTRAKTVEEDGALIGAAGSPVENPGLDESVALPVCRSCEKDLAAERGKWVCRERGCGLEGQEQRVNGRKK